MNEFGDDYKERADALADVRDELEDEVAALRSDLQQAIDALRRLDEIVTPINQFSPLMEARRIIRETLVKLGEKPQ